MQLQTTAVDPTEENRVKDLRKLVESLVKFSAFHQSVLKARPNRLKCDADFWSEFHSRSHDEHCDFLESKGTSVYAMAFALHLILTGVGLYVPKQDADVIIHDTSLFKGSLAIQELVLLLLVAGQDSDRSHYKKEGLFWAYFFLESLRASGRSPSRLSVSVSLARKNGRSLSNRVGVLSRSPELTA
jgi:hypothetical protein